MFDQESLFENERTWNSFSRKWFFTILSIVFAPLLNFYHHLECFYYVNESLFDCPPDSNYKMLLIVHPILSACLTIMYIISYVSIAEIEPE